MVKLQIGSGPRLKRLPEVLSNTIESYLDITSIQTLSKCNIDRSQNSLLFSLEKMADDYDKISTLLTQMNHRKWFSKIDNWWERLEQGLVRIHQSPRKEIALQSPHLWHFVYLAYNLKDSSETEQLLNAILSFSESDIYRTRCIEKLKATWGRIAKYWIAKHASFISENLMISTP